MKKIVYLIIGILYLSGMGFAGKGATFPDLVHPKNLVIDGGHIIVTDYPSIYLYSLKDYHLVKKIGSKGQGPGEFYIDREWMDRKLAGLVTYVFGDCIYVNSMGRLSVFSNSGDLVKTHSAQAFGGGFAFQPVGDKFVGFQTVGEKNEIFSAINLYDSNLKIVKEIFRQSFWLRSRHTREIDFFERANGTLPFLVGDNKIFIGRGNNRDILFDIFDKEGKKINTIRLAGEKIKVPDSFIKRVHAYFRLKFKRGLEHNLKHTTFSEYFPAVRRFTIKGNKIYVLTYKRGADSDNELIILDFAGKVLRKATVPVFEKNPEHLFPFSIHGGKFYQLVENEETEEWELVINEIK